ncbi:hypothetical protein NA56DRAFT_596167 [Hyaloscypha hepaticicola]|uniref:Xylanolytic transcriptional activator regulatory domain-containing protein n=1 Tax=Hyaloscypha hepaticicola TaxID=2082293 RepID=A0A2J6QBU1_9HELO|nr:hypothetical protein NA56DRAFT_596167 [Hyaloscypha hepaticicola]
MVSTPEGLECLILQGLYHINAGNPRRAWLTLRRALNLGQLMGIHRRKGSTIPGGREMWFNAVRADRYLGLLLGLPCGSADVDFGPDETFQNPNISLDELFNRKLCNIVGRVIERNQSESPQVYATTQNIDEQLEQLHNDMPKSWWEIPAFIPNDNSLEAVQIFNRIMSEMWYFQVLAFLHLPFMLKASKERRYEYSRFSCLKASREMVNRYLALRKAGTSSFCCNVVDFGALTCTITLYLVSVMESEASGESHAQRQQREADEAMVQAVLKHMEELSQGGRDLVATQSVNVIKSLLAISSPDSLSGRQTGNLKLTIPYFGTISIVRPPSVEQNYPSDVSYLQQGQQQSLPMGQGLPSQPWQNSFTPRSPGFTTQTKIPTISFMSSQFPEFSCQVPCSEPEPQQQQQLPDWNLPEDNLFFDSLLQTDLEGNWIF